MTSERMGLASIISGMRRKADGEEPQPRAVGSPLPMGARDRSAVPLHPHLETRPQPVPNPNRQPSFPPRPAPLQTAPEPPSGMSRAVNTIRSLLPYVQKLLPLLDGNVGTAVANVLTHRANSQRPSQAVNLAPIENGLVDLQSQQLELQSEQRELRGQIAEQTTSLKRVEHQLDMVREATDRNTLEQQELLEDLKSVHKKVAIYAYCAIALLVVSVALSVILYLHVRRVIP